MRYKFLLFIFMLFTPYCYGDGLGFLGPYNQEMYQKTDEIMKVIHREHSKCEDYFIYPKTISIKNFWKHYRLYVLAWVDLEQLYDRAMIVDSPLDVKKDALDIKKKMDELDKLLEPIRKKANEKLASKED